MFNEEGILFGFVMFYGGTSDSNVIELNVLQGNDHGVYLGGSSNHNIIKANQATENIIGLMLVDTHNNTVISNQVFENEYGGIELGRSCDNIVAGNRISNHPQYGICPRGDRNTIFGNTIQYCGHWGIDLRGVGSSHQNVFYHNNLMNNQDNALDNNDNIWYGSFPVGGNYWDDFEGGTWGIHDDYSGEQQTILGSDGIIDKGSDEGGGLNPCHVPGQSQNVDNYPLLNPWVNVPPNQPHTPHPSQREGQVNTRSSLSWMCDDPDTDFLFFDVYFGTQNPPAQVSWNQTETVFQPEKMRSETTYYWRIVAWDFFGASSESPVWSFTTQDDTVPPEITIVRPQKGMLYLSDYLECQNPLGNMTVIVGQITIVLKAFDEITEIEKIELYIDGRLQASFNETGSHWVWEKRSYLRHLHKIKAVAYDIRGNSASDELFVWRLF